MKKIFIVCASILFAAILHAQNVGIGTLTPTEKLEIKNTLRTTLKISSGSYNDTTQLIFSNKINPTAGTDFSITSIKEQGLFFSSSSDITANNSPNSLVILPTGNIGIGTNVPAYRFQVHDPVAANNYMNVSNSTTGNSANDGLLVGLTGNSAILTNLENGNLRLGTNNLTRVMIEADGDVGIGTLSPLAKLHVNGAMKIEGLNTLEFGAGVAGKEINAGKIGYNSFVPDALCIIGSGTSASNRKVNFFAEGGTTFNGPINVGGSTGIAGQVLTSNNLAAPSWETLNTAFNNDVRFEAGFNGSSSVSLTPTLNYTTTYNLNTTAITIATSGITVNHSGLYHIEGYLDLQYTLTQAPAYIQQGLIVNIDSRGYKQSSTETFDVDPSTPFRYKKFFRFIIEVYISAPGIVNLSVENNLNMGVASLIFCSHSGRVSGHLISD